MKWLSVIDTTIIVSNKKVILNFCLMMVCLIITANTIAADNPWTTTVIPQAYWQSYSGTATRDNSFSFGANVTGDYLESSRLGVGYNFTLVDLDNNATIVENLLYATGSQHWFLDALPGKLTLRLDVYGGNSTLEYNINTPPTGMKKKLVSGSSNKQRESTTISALQPIVSFINYNKTLYLDLGYAYSDYTKNLDTTVTQVTPTLGFGWNDSYDWLQVRSYLIKLDESDGLYNDSNYSSMELSYTHWFAAGAASNLDFFRITMLGGKRVLAVDPDSAVVYSNGDIQTGTLAASAQWKFSETNRFLLLANYNNYKNDVVNDKYSGLLFYLNTQHQW